MSEANKTNSKSYYEVTYADLPLHCPTPDMSVWNSHPRVFLPIEETGKAKCPYCGAEYVLIDWDPNHHSH
ncbi:MAG: zinc-finger domain-containing protein [Thiomicrorhabdus chilensis]|uniref:zinc-finger domain-containing protein n=1 Tax=Thiomicrorhabdus chilensis TaxID=63656 RepID=UPI00299DDC36|nr:zinc-finger domain-containing protein [Thiomicrorhabdus chilensis]MDX1347260.1 zinc-finger domain-containing protein [Thiomicrorhabdus chilensis]